MMIEEWWFRWQPMIINIFVGLIGVTFIWFTGWRGFAGFIIGGFVVGYYIMSDDQMVKYVVELVRKL